MVAISFDLIFHKYPKGNEFTSEKKSTNPAIEAQVTAIASKFVCSCRTKECNYISLESCTCGTAAEERQFIRDNLEQSANGGKKTDEIVVAVANKYGLLKPEFASKYKVDRSRVWNDN